jgi:hypothetical protein
VKHLEFVRQIQCCPCLFVVDIRDDKFSCFEISSLSLENDLVLRHVQLGLTVHKFLTKRYISAFLFL